MRMRGAVPAFAQVQGQLLGAGRPANRARIQLTCSLTEFPKTVLAVRDGYLTNRTRSFCSQSRATVAAVRANGTALSISPLIKNKGPNAGCWPSEFLEKNSLTYGLFPQPGLNISLAGGTGPELASQARLRYSYSRIPLSVSISSIRN